ncbi:MAG: hypothetical protein JWM78_461 [Verrucomicrobiaceae bacterium]|nr:hypothetical protein [Verrucomicrobiaceae bacterium]
MPLILAGIAWLAEFLMIAAAAIFSWFMQYLSKRLLLVAYAVAAMLSLTAIFFVTVGALLTGLESVVPPYFVVALGLVVPSNFTSCASAIGAAHLARWIYAWKVRIFMMKSAN